MDGRTPPPDQQPSPMGFSVGRWDGATLIVETTHLSPGWLDGSGLPMSGDTRIEERYEVSADRLSIARTMTIHDPVYYTAPLVRQRHSARSDTMRIVEQAPCDPDSYYRDLAAGGRLEEHFERD